MLVNSMDLTSALGVGVLGGTFIASVRPPVGPSLLQIFIRIIGSAFAGGIICGGGAFLVGSITMGYRFGAADVLAAGTILSLGRGLIAGAIAGIVSIILNHSYS